MQEVLCRSVVVGVRPNRLANYRDDTPKYHIQADCPKSGSLDPLTELQWRRLVEIVEIPFSRVLVWRKKTRFMRESKPQVPGCLSSIQFSDVPSFL